MKRDPASVVAEVGLIPFAVDRDINAVLGIVVHIAVVVVDRMIAYAGLRIVVVISVIRHNHGGGGPGGGLDHDGRAAPDIKLVNVFSGGRIPVIDHAARAAACRTDLTGDVAGIAAAGVAGQVDRSPVLEIDQKGGLGIPVGRTAHGAIGHIPVGRLVVLPVHIDIGCAGTGGLAFVIEGAVGTPAVHIRRDVADAERGAALARDRGISEHVGKACGRVFTAVRGNHGPGQRVEHIGAGHKLSRAAGLLALIGRVLRDAEVGRLCRLNRLRLNRLRLDRLHGLNRLGRRRLRRRRGVRIQDGRTRDLDGLGRCLRTVKHRKAVGQTRDVVGICGIEPFKADAASLLAGQGVDGGGIVLLGRDGHAVCVGVRNLTHAAVHHGMLVGIRRVAEGPVLQRDRGLDRVDIVIRKDKGVIEQIVPRIGLAVVVGVDVVRQDVGEGLFLEDVQPARGKGGAVLTDLPDLHVRRAVCRVLGRGNKLEPAVMVQVGHRIIPVFRCIILLQRAHLRRNQADLGADIARRESSGRTDSSHRQQKRRSQKDTEPTFLHLLSSILLSSAAI